MLLALHSAMGEGHSCSTSIWQVDPLTAGFPFPVCAALRMGWAKSSESWETLNAISRNNTASQKPQVPVFSPLWCLTMQWDAHIILFCYSLGYVVSLLDVHYVWTKGRSEGKRNGWSVSDSITRSRDSHVPLHSWILLVQSRSSSTLNQRKINYKEAKALFVLLQRAPRATICWLFCKDLCWHFFSGYYQLKFLQPLHYSWTKRQNNKVIWLQRCLVTRVSFIYLTDML